MSTIQNLPENRFNFLRFYPEITPQIASSQYTEGLHNGYLYRWRKQKDFLPVLVNDTLTFYTNFATDIIGGNTVRILEGDTIINDVTKYDLTVTPFGTENSVIELTIPVTNTSNNKVFNIGVIGATGTTTLEENTKISGNAIISGYIYKVLKLSTGNFIMVGDFSLTDYLHENVVVIDPNGDIVTSYSFGFGFNGAVYDVAEQADGKLIFVGDFDVYSGTLINRIVRTSATGVYDSTFNVGSGADRALTEVEIDSVGNVYIGGISGFFYNGSGSTQNIYKLSSTGARDVSYTPSSVTPRDLKIQSDDKLLVATNGGNGVRRLNTNGTTDGTFTSGLFGGAQANVIELDADGNIYVGGSFLYLASSQKVAKLSSSGVLDGTFVTTIEDEVLSIRREDTQLYVSGIGFANIIGLTGTDVEVLDITAGQVNNFVYLSPIFYLLTSGVTFNYGSGVSTSITLVETITTFPILYRSNCFILKQLTEANINNTHLISFYNNSSVYNYEWGAFNIATDTPYTVRIPSSIKELSYGKDQTVYTSATTGTSRVTRATTSKNYQFETYYNNEDFHDAFSVASSFKYFGVNGKEYICEEYGIEYQQNMNIFKGVANLKDVEYGRRVNVCSNLT